MVHYLSFIPTDYGLKHGLKPHSIVGQFLDGTERITPDNFARNPAFVEFLHQSLAEHGPNCPELIAEAERTGNGTVTIIDLRIPDFNAAIPPENIIGIFSVADGKIREYHKCPKHQLFNEHGFMKLDPWLHERLLANLMQTG